jgi:hypothetical protein
MKKVVKQTLVISSVSVALLTGVTLMVVNRRTKNQVVYPQIKQSITNNKRLSSEYEIFRDDSDLGYC